MSLLDMDKRTLLQAAGFGLLAGIRSMSAPALVSNYLAENRPQRLEDTPVEFLVSPAVGTVLQVAALGEMVADKMPFIPARTRVSSLLWRSLTGAITGATVGAVNKRQIVTTAVIGAGFAIVGAYAAYEVRREVKERYGVPDALLGTVEDVLVLGGGAALVRATAETAAET